MFVQLLALCVRKHELRRIRAGACYRNLIRSTCTCLTVAFSEAGRTAQ